MCCRCGGTFTLLLATIAADHVATCELGSSSPTQVAARNSCIVDTVDATDTVAVDAMLWRFT